MSIRNKTKGVKMKKVALAVAVVLGLVVVYPVQAAETNTIAIIDTAIDSNKVKSVVYEVCFTQNKSCPNGSTFMEGRGAANAVVWPSNTNSAIYHGYNMTQAALVANPNINIVFVRIADMTVSGNSLNSGQSLSSAIDWVSKNSARLNIKAVSISQSRTNFAVGSCPSDVVFSNAVKVLNSQEVPTFAATGNDGRKNQVGFPACVEGVIGVGGLKPDQTFASYTNIGLGLDIVSRGDANIQGYCGCKTMTITGTSVATPIVVVSSVTRKTSGSWNEYIASLPKVQNYPYVG